MPTKTHRSPTDHRIFEQSTTDIWSALSQCSKHILASSGIDHAQVKGVGFDATCSLAAVDKNGTPISISRTGATEEDESDEHLGKEGEWNVVLWADHRAEEEAQVINETGEGVLGFVGETMSVSPLYGSCKGGWLTTQLEMEIPKTLWLKKHMDSERFKRCMLFECVASVRECRAG